VSGRATGTATGRRRRKKGERASSKPPRSAPVVRSRGLRLIVLGAVGALCLTLLAAVSLWARSPRPGAGKPVAFTADPGVSSAELAQRLFDTGALESPRLFALYFELFGKAPAPGAHLLRDDLSPRELAQRLGRSAGRPAVRVTLPEGWNHVQIGRRLEELEVTPLAGFRAAVMDPRLGRELGLPGSSVEGYLFPATYELFVDSDPASVVRTLVAEAKKRFGRLEAADPAAFERLGREQGFRLHDVVTLASIVERETGHPEELPLVAGVFMNRLSDPTFRPLKTLQSDPTAAYGCLVEPTRAVSCAVASGQVTPGMLRDAANRYNTYRHPGLPPGPIGNPGERAMRAVLAPAKTEYLYFVAGGQGKHRFSKTFDEHREAIERRRQSLTP
jgi:UPF0755 protein